MLIGEDGRYVYVGQSTNPLVRLYQHRVTYGPHIKMRIVQNTFQNETPDEAERKWIARYKTFSQHIENVRSVEDNKSEWLKIRASAQDKVRFMKAAMRSGLSLSGWIRYKLGSAADEELGDKIVQ